MTGAEDRICPPSVNRSNSKHQQKARSTTDSREFPGRSHWPGQDGWEEVADYALDWTVKQAAAARAALQPATPAP